MKHLTKPVAAVAVAAALLVTGCSGSEDQGSFPGAAIGTWVTDEGDLRKMVLSDGGRVDLTLADGTTCSGTFSIENYSDDAASMSTGYIQCQPLMDGYASNELTLSDGNLVVDGTWGGTYSPG